jgi:hypothetical protein
MWVGGQRNAPAALPQEKEPVPMVYEAGWALGLVCTVAENLAHTNVRTPQHPAPGRSELLHGLRYAGRLLFDLYTSKFSSLKATQERLNGQACSTGEG